MFKRGLKTPSCCCLVSFKGFIIPRRLKFSLYFRISIIALEFLLFLLILFYLFCYREEVGVIGNDDRCTRMRRMSGDTPQARVFRYKEERRKQLASQFAHLNRNPDSSSSSSPASDVNFTKATFKLHNHYSIQGNFVHLLHHLFFWWVGLATLF